MISELTEELLKTRIAVEGLRSDLNGVIKEIDNHSKTLYGDDGTKGIIADVVYMRIILKTVGITIGALIPFLLALFWDKIRAILL